SLDLGMLRGEPRLHDRRLLDLEALEAAVRRGQRDDGARPCGHGAGAQPDLRRVASFAFMPPASSVNARKCVGETSAVRVAAGLATARQTALVCWAACAAAGA